MVAPLLHVRDIGIQFICTVQQNLNGVLTTLDLSGYDTFQLEFWNETLQPYQIVVATLLNIGPSGQITYTIASSSFINMAGTWRVRPIIKSSLSNVTLSGSFYEFEVEQ
jgi:hypothetical protein